MSMPIFKVIDKWENDGTYEDYEHGSSVIAVCETLARAKEIIDECLETAQKKLEDFELCQCDFGEKYVHVFKYSDFWRYDHVLYIESGEKTDKIFSKSSTWEDLDVLDLYRKNEDYKPIF